MNLVFCIRMLPRENLSTDASQESKISEKKGCVSACIELFLPVMRFKLD